MGEKSDTNDTAPNSDPTNKSTSKVPAATSTCNDTRKAGPIKKGERLERISNKYTGEPNSSSGRKTKSHGRAKGPPRAKRADNQATKRFFDRNVSENKTKHQSHDVVNVGEIKLEDHQKIDKKEN